MEAVEITAKFEPEPGDRTALSKASRATLEKLYQHPLAHNLEWLDVVALFTRLGTVEHKSHNDIAFGIAGEHHVMRKPHNKDLTAAEVMEFRHILSRAGWSPALSPQPGAEPDEAGPNATPAPDVLVVVEHREARLYQLEIRSADSLGHVIRPYDPHHFLHHLAHKDQSRERGQRAPEDRSFYRRIAEAVVPAGRIVLIGHGEGHSNAAHHLTEYLRLHHPETFQKVTCEVVADLSSLTPPQLLALGHRALSPGTNPFA